MDFDTVLVQMRMVGLGLEQGKEEGRDIELEEVGEVDYVVE